MTHAPSSADHAAWALGLPGAPTPPRSSFGDDPWAVPGSRPHQGGGAVTGARSTDSGAPSDQEPGGFSHVSVLSGCVSAAFATLAYAQSLRLENLNPRPRPTWTRVVAQADRVDATAARSVLDELRGL